MRLIDAHKLWDVMNKATLHHIVTNTLWNTMKSVIENAPTIDAVEVVRCKDCKWYDNRDVCHNPRYGDGHANYSPPYVDEEYWCKDGERKKP